MKLWRKSIDLFGQRWGVEKSTLYVADSKEKYMDRYILYIAGFTARLHHFFHGDDDRAPHDHPWNFWTFPLTTYVEKLPIEGCDREWWEYRHVRAFRPHYRKAEFQHIVCGRPRIGHEFGWEMYEDTRPFWTLVFTGRRQRMWGFWPDEETFIDYRSW